MRWLVIYLLVVTFLPLAWSEVNVVAGNVYEVNVIVVSPIEPNATWLGVYGNVGEDGVRRSWDYFSTAFGQFTVSPPPTVTSVSISGRTLAVPILLPNHWFVGISESPDVNLYDLNGTCDANVDALIDGNFCSDCLPSKTFATDVNVTLNGKTVCASTAYVTSDLVPVYLLEYNGFPVYVSPVGVYTWTGPSPAFMSLISVPGTTTFSVYLLRDRFLCGDYVCDPGEEENCTSDCVAISIAADPTSADVNVEQTATFVITVSNETNTLDVDVNIVVSSDIAPGDSTYTYSLTRDVVFVPRLDENTSVLSVTPHAAGTYTLRVSAYLGGTEVDHVTITVVAHAPESEEEEETGGGGGGVAPPPEENVEAVPIEGGGYWIPALGCISNIQVVGPDRVTALLEENVAVNIFLQNAGTCDENVHVDVSGVPDDWVYLPQRDYTLKGGEGVALPLHIYTKAPGVYTVTVTGKGYTGGYHRFQLLVAKERAKAAEKCTHNIIVVAPEEVTVVEGEDVNNILISNAGTCREPVSILVKKRVGDLEVVLDKKEFYLSGGEKYVYNMPKLASGEYELYLSAGNVSKTSKIHVAPPPVLGEFSETLVRLRWALILVMFIILIGAIGYIRYRYLR